MRIIVGLVAASVLFPVGARAQSLTLEQLPAAIVKRWDVRAGNVGSGLVATVHFRLKIDGSLDGEPVVLMLGNLASRTPRCASSSRRHVC